MPSNPSLRAAAFVALIVALPAGSGAQVTDLSVRGRIVPNLAASQDTASHYAAYLPPSFTDSVATPLLLVLDPRGRADSALARLTPTLDQLGWVALSSYDTRGEASPADNQRIVNLMLADAFAALRLDTARIYLAGSGGTATDAWILAFGSRGHVAGIVSVGSGMPGDSAWRAAHAGRPPFDVAMAAARTSYVGETVTASLRRLVADSAPAWAGRYAGPDRWPPAAVLARALGWLQVRAMARGLMPFDSAFADSVFAVDSAAAAGDVGRRPARAADEWERIALAWNGSHDVAHARTMAAALAERPDVRRYRAERDSLSAETPAERAAVVRTLVAIRKRPGAPDLRRLTDDLHVVPLQRWAADSADSVRAIWARRRLDELYAQVSHFESEAYLAVGDAPRALAMLDLAEEIRPETPEVCRERARAYALLLNSDRTLAGLRCALAGGAITVREIRTDPRYRFMRERDEFLRMIGVKKQ